MFKTKGNKFEFEPLVFRMNILHEYNEKIITTLLPSLAQLSHYNIGG